MPMQNNIQISIGTYDSSGADTDTTNTDSTNTNSGISVNTTFDTSSDATIEGMSLKSNTSTNADSVSNKPSTGFSLGNNVATCMVENIPLQKWVHILTSLYGRSLDVYLDGNLVRTCVLPGVAKINPDSDLHITPSGGFSGYTSGLQYWNDSKNPQEVWNIYKKGFGGSALGNLFNKYRIKVSFLEDNKEQGSFEV